MEHAAEAAQPAISRPIAAVRAPLSTIILIELSSAAGEWARDCIFVRRGTRTSTCAEVLSIAEALRKLHRAELSTARRFEP
jgi:hypothetical protein